MDSDFLTKYAFEHSHESNISKINDLAIELEKLTQSLSRSDQHLGSISDTIDR